MSQTTRRQLLKTLGLAAPALSAAAAGPEEGPPWGRDVREVTDEQRQLVAYCGLYCGLCSGHCRLPEPARVLLETLRQDEAPVPEEVRAYLTDMVNRPPDTCCRLDKCGHPDCAIRKCARERGLTACPFCDDFPCDRIHTLAASEVTLLHDGARMRKLGLEAWIKEQEARRARGFCYSDIRCLPCIIPTE